MSLKCFDEAMKKKLKDVFPNVVFGPLSKAFNNNADSENVVLDENTGGVIEEDNDVFVVKDKQTVNRHATETYTKTYGDETTHMQGVVGLPMIAVDRINNQYEFEFQANDPLTRKGRWVSEDVVLERALPCLLTYQIDIVSDRRFEVDEIWREVSMYLYVHNSLPVIYSPNTEEEFEEDYEIRLTDTDNATDVETHDDNGVIYRQTITVEIHNAKLLFDRSTPVVKEIPVRFIKINMDKEDDVDE